MADTSFFVIAIDFGTTYSGYCFCVQSNMEQIRQVFWGKEHGLNTLKTPTCILFDENMEFKQFGYDAAMKYHTLRSRDAQSWYFFKHFKMELYNKKITSDMSLAAANGKGMAALKVFSESLRFMMTHAMKTIKEATTFHIYNAEDVTWVLTVPAIWDSGAKHFMRLAAKEAGLITELHSQNLVIALEPEAASIWCKQLPREGFLDEGADRELFEDSPGIQYIVVDCGGGTIDITVHEIQPDKSLKELEKPSGGEWGGSIVDKNFLELLKQIFHSEVWEDYVSQHPAELHLMLYNFGLQKCSKLREDVYIRCFYNLTTLAEKRRSMSEYFLNQEGVSWAEGTIKITYEKMKSFYIDCIKNTTRALQDIVQKPKNNKVKYIILVGGFAASVIFRDGIYDAFQHTHRVLCPYESQAAILKGAVLFGNNPTIIGGRICARTYGIAVCATFDISVHDIRKRLISKDGLRVYCNDIFEKLMGNGELVQVSQVASYTYCPIEHDQSAMYIGFYSTEKDNAKYVDEEGMIKVGSFSLAMPNEALGLNRKVRLDLNFGLSEIKATATDLTSNECQTVIIDFLTR